MYNRYIPQSDGSFRRSRVSDPETIDTKEEPALAQDIIETLNQLPESKPVKKAAANNINHRTSKSYHPPLHNQQSESVSSFLKRLLPANFDTEDLIVVLLLLLMSGNSAKDQNTAMLTLAIYLFT